MFVFNAFVIGRGRRKKQSEATSKLDLIIGGIVYPWAMILEKLTWVSTKRATSGSAALKRVVKAAVGVRIAKSPAW